MLIQSILLSFDLVTPGSISSFLPECSGNAEHLSILPIYQPQVYYQQVPADKSYIYISFVGSWDAQQTAPLRWRHIAELLCQKIQQPYVSHPSFVGQRKTVRIPDQNMIGAPSQAITRVYCLHILELQSEVTQGMLNWACPYKFVYFLIVSTMFLMSPFSSVKTSPCYLIAMASTA